jgi:hypothetical protein
MIFKSVERISGILAEVDVVKKIRIISITIALTDLTHYSD